MVPHTIELERRKRYVVSYSDRHSTSFYCGISTYTSVVLSFTLSSQSPSPNSESPSTSLLPCRDSKWSVCRESSVYIGWTFPLSLLCLLAKKRGILRSRLFVYDDRFTMAVWTQCIESFLHRSPKWNVRIFLPGQRWSEKREDLWFSWKRNRMDTDRIQLMMIHRIQYSISYPVRVISRLFFEHEPSLNSINAHPRRAISARNDVIGEWLLPQTQV